MKDELQILIEYHKRILSLLSPFMIFSMAIMFMGQYSFIRHINNNIVLSISFVIICLFLIFTLLCIYIEFYNLEIKNKILHFISICMTIVYLIVIIAITIIGVFNSTKIIMIAFGK